MALERFKCSRCGDIQTAFEDDLKTGGNCDRMIAGQCHEWEKLPTVAKVVLATSGYMQDYQLDSLPSLYELDRILNIEAREEKEMKVFQDYIKNV